MALIKEHYDIRKMQYEAHRRLQGLHSKTVEAIRAAPPPRLVVQSPWEAQVTLYVYLKVCIPIVIQQRKLTNESQDNKRPKACRMTLTEQRDVPNALSDVGFSSPSEMVAWFPVDRREAFWVMDEVQEFGCFHLLPGSTVILVKGGVTRLPYIEQLASTSVIHWCILCSFPGCSVALRGRSPTMR